MRSSSARLPLVAILASAAVVAYACRSSAPNASPDAPPAPNRELITADQMADHRFNSVFDAVASLRSNWMTKRGADSFQERTVTDQFGNKVKVAGSAVRVYLDNVLLGDTASLRQIPTTNIVYIKHFD